jgi:type I restriction enzyme, R subunit
VIRTALANPLDKFELGIRRLIEEMMIERMGENGKIVTRYMTDRNIQCTAFPILAREVLEEIHAGKTANGGQEETRETAAWNLTIGDLNPPLRASRL